VSSQLVSSSGLQALTQLYQPTQQVPTAPPINTQFLQVLQESSEKEGDSQLLYQNLYTTVLLHTILLPPPPSSSSSSSDPLQLVKPHLNQAFPATNDALWKSLQLNQHLTRSLAKIAHSKPHKEVLESLVSVLHDRLAHVPEEIATTLPSMLQAFGIGIGSDTINNNDNSIAMQNSMDSLALSVVSSLAAVVQQASARRRLWHEVQSAMLPCLSRAFDRILLLLNSNKDDNNNIDDELVYQASLACRLLYFYALEAPPIAKKKGSLNTTLVKSDVWRPAVLLFTKYQGISHITANSNSIVALSSALNYALLLCSASSQPLLDWAMAVPGFSTSFIDGVDDERSTITSPCGGGDFINALWECIINKSDASLVNLIEYSTASSIPDGLLEVCAGLQLMVDLSKASSSGSRTWSEKTRDKMKELKEKIVGSSKSYSISGNEEGGGREEKHHEEEVTAELTKLKLTAEQQAGVLEERRARKLHSVSLVLVKSLLETGHHQGDGGAYSSKAD
jgi:hypothetical protein